MDTQRFDFNDLLVPVGLPFSIKFGGHLNLLICNVYNAKTYFKTFQTSHFGINIHKLIMFFDPPSWIPLFSFYVNLFGKLSIHGALLKPQGARTFAPCCNLLPTMDTQSFDFDDCLNGSHRGGNLAPINQPILSFPPPLM